MAREANARRKPIFFGKVVAIYFFFAKSETLL
jgi:hypothetical protein